MKYLDPKADLTFKKIFGNHPRRLISLLNALLPLSEEEQIHEIKYLPTELVLEINSYRCASGPSVQSSFHVQTCVRYDRNTLVFLKFFVSYE